MPDKSGRTPNGDVAPRHESGDSSPAASTGRAASSTDVDRRAVERVLAAVREAGVQQIELQFADVTGAVKTVAVPARRIAAVLADGEWFDGSAIEGLAREVESDMYLRPDPTTFSIMEPSGVPCARLICDVVTPGGEPYRGDGRGMLRSLLDAAESFRAKTPQRNQLVDSAPLTAGQLNLLARRGPI